MEDNIILFDDWKTRSSDTLKNRKNEYLIALITLIILLFISIFGLFFHWGLIIFLIISLIGINVKLNILNFVHLTILSL